ncbi:MAG: hypothetical protein H6713_28260 [Myxococcales bacterium]|nr:hypothetical protein [Myxococcales bacterium]
MLDHERATQSTPPARPRDRRRGRRARLRLGARARRRAAATRRARARRRDAGPDRRARAQRAPDPEPRAFVQPPAPDPADGELPIAVRSATLELTPGLLGQGLRANVEYVVAGLPGVAAPPPGARLVTRVACLVGQETRADVLTKPLLGVSTGPAPPRSGVAFFDLGLPAAPLRCELDFYFQPGVLASEATRLPERFSHDGGGRPATGTPAGSWSVELPLEVRRTTLALARADEDERYLDVHVTLLRGEAALDDRQLAVTARCALRDGTMVTGDSGVYGELWALEPGDLITRRVPVFFEDAPELDAPRRCALRWRLDTPLEPELRAPLGVFCLEGQVSETRAEAAAGACTPAAPAPTAG